MARYRRSNQSGRPIVAVPSDKRDWIETAATVSTGPQMTVFSPMADHSLPRKRGAGSFVADSVTFTGLVATLTTTIVLGVAFGLAVAGAW